MRYNRIDNLRALSIISMVLYHAAWDLVFLYNFNWSWYKGLPGYIWQQSICWCFILLSGFCHSISRRPLKNSLRIFAAGLLVSVVTWILTPNIRITFGILTFIGSAGIICSTFHKPLKNINSVCGIIMSAFLFAFTKNINTGSLGFFDFELIHIPRCLYANYFSAYLGMPSAAFRSSDYFSLLPWLFLYLTGFFIYKYFSENNLMPYLKGKPIKFFAYLSKRSLWIYLLHQPIISALFYLIF